MAATTEELESRLATVEAEVARLRQRIEPVVPLPESLGAELIRRAKASQEALSAAWEQAQRDMGIADVKPIGAEKLREMMLAEGIRPEENLLSSEIIRLRELTRG